MRVGLLGGSFDPVHNGHLALASAARRQLRLSKVWFVLSPRSPFKMDRAQTPVRTRLALLSLALKGQRAFKIGRWELKRRGPSYTISTLQHYKRKHPSDHVHLIMGSDALAGFPRWRRADDIRRLARLAVGLRPHAVRRVPASLKISVDLLRGRFPDVSSTELRRAYVRGKSVRGRVPAVVDARIRREKIYATKE
jgi:nicotinate-nucleotide adenylyltransferase